MAGEIGVRSQFSDSSLLGFCLRLFLALLWRYEPDGPLRWLGRHHEFPQPIEHLFELQAEEFISKVKTSSDPRIRNFNMRIYNKFMREGFRRMPPRGIE